MIRRPPQRNMPPNMSSWGQWVESELADIRASTKVQGQSVDRALSGTNASLTTLVEQQQRLQESLQFLHKEYSIVVYPNGATIIPVLDIYPPSWASQGIITLSASKTSGAELPADAVVELHLGVFSESTNNTALSLRVTKTSTVIVYPRPIAITSDTENISVRVGSISGLSSRVTITGTLDAYINWA